MKSATVLQSLALLLSQRQQLAAAAATARLIYEFPAGVFVENIAERPNGKLVLTNFDQGKLYGIDPAARPAVPTVLVQPANITATSGITSIGGDKYSFTGCDNNLAEFRCNPGTIGIYTVDLAQRNPTARLAARLPNATLPNGQTSLPKYPHVILTGDSFSGELIRVDTRTGASCVVLQSPLWERSPLSPVPIGINGVHILGNTLYWSNSGQGTFGKATINDRGDKVTDVRVTTTLPTAAAGDAWDDFALTSKGAAYITIHPNRLNYIAPDGTYGPIVYGPGSGNVTLVEPTAAALGKGGKVVYVVTGGDLTGQTGQGGQVVEITL